MTPTPETVQKLYAVAAALETSPSALYKIIAFESRWNPKAGEGKARGPYGLLQFMPSTLASLSITPAQLFQMSAEGQLDIVQRYFQRFKDLSTEQKLYMAVFYPVAQNWPAGRTFPEHVQKVNPGIRTPQDYMDKVNAMHVPAEVIERSTERRAVANSSRPSSGSSRFPMKLLLVLGLGGSALALIAARILRG